MTKSNRYFKISLTTADSKQKLFKVNEGSVAITHWTEDLITTVERNETLKRCLERHINVKCTFGIGLVSTGVLPVSFLSVFFAQGNMQIMRCFGRFGITCPT